MNTRRSTIVPYKAVLTEKNLADQSGKVFLVTGASGGLGKLLANILYQHNAKVWLAARSEDKTRAVMEEFRRNHPQSRGELKFLKLELDDLRTIKPAAEKFLAEETRLDVLWNNAGVMVPPQGSKTVQGYELQIGVNNLAHFLFTSLVTPLLRQTAKTAPANSVRVIWVSSSAADAAPFPAIDFDNMDYRKEEGAWAKYSRSKAGNAIHNFEFAKRNKDSGIVSLALNPGNFVTNLQQNMPKIQVAFFRLIAHDPVNGAYTQLFAGLHPSITTANSGGWVSPFGKTEALRKDLGDPEQSKKYWEWSEAQVAPFM